MKVIFSFLVLFLFGGLLRAQQVQTEAGLPVNEIAAQVEEKIITWNDIRRELEPLVPQIRAESASQRDFQRRISEVSRQILGDLIDRVLIIREFNEEGYQIPPDFLENAFDDYLIEEFNNDRAEFLRFLRARGLNELTFREQLKERMIVDFMRSRTLGSRTSVSPEQVQAYYEAEENRSRFFQEEGVKLRMITLRPQGPETLEGVLSRAETLVAELRDGAEFAETAMQFSEDERADEGGDWGWVRRETLRAEIAELAFGMEVGQISDPLAINQSVYILKIEDKRDAGVQDLSVVRGEIEQAIATQLARQANERWLQRLRDEYYWHIFSTDVPILFGGPDTNNTIEMNLSDRASPLPN